MLGTLDMAHSSRRLVRAPVPVQLSPLAPPGELLRAESVASMRRQLTAQGVDVSCWGVNTNRIFRRDFTDFPVYRKSLSEHFQ